MEKDTVLLSLERYNSLRDLEKMVLNKEIIEINKYHTCNNAGVIDYHPTCFYTSVTNKELLDNIKIQSDELKKKSGELEKKSYELEKKMGNISKIKKMSVFEFLKWRKEK
jgi:hypothetical protein